MFCNGVLFPGPPTAKQSSWLLHHFLLVGLEISLVNRSITQEAQQSILARRSGRPSSTRTTMPAHSAPTSTMSIHLLVASMVSRTMAQEVLEPILARRNEMQLSPKGLPFIHYYSKIPFKVNASRHLKVSKALRRFQLPSFFYVNKELHKRRYH